MRRNRRRYAKLSQVNHKVIGFFSAIALVITLGAFINLSLRSSIRKTGEEIGKLEAASASHRADRTRAETRWAECTNPERLEAALNRHGLNMELASGERIVSLRGKKPTGAIDSSSTEMASYEPARRP